MHAYGYSVSGRCNDDSILIVMFLDVYGGKSNASIWRIYNELCISVFMESNCLRLPGMQHYALGDFTFWLRLSL